MIAKALVFVCAAFGLVSGTCFEIVAPQQCSQSSSSQVITIPAVTESAPVFVSASSGCDNAFTEIVSSGSSSSESSSCCLQPGNGPETSDSPVIQSPCVTLPAVEGPTITLCSPPIPAPRVIAQRCICTKTIVRPQVYERTVTVPRIQRYIKRTVTPVVENVSYKSTPITQENGSSSAYVQAGSNSGSGSGSGCSQSRIIISSGSSCPRSC